MKKILFSVVLLGCTACAGAQSVYYLFFQSAGDLPFYVKMGDKVFSGDNGYLTIPNLVDSTYYVKVGLVNANAHEATFSIVLNDKDRGFLVKLGDDGLLLTDIQSNSLLKGDDPGASESVSYERRNDMFTTLLAKASDDSGLLWVPVYTRADVAAKKANGSTQREAQAAKETVKTEPVHLKEEVQPEKQDSTRSAAAAVVNAIASPGLDSAATAQKKPDTVSATVVSANVTQVENTKKAETDSQSLASQTVQGIGTRTDTAVMAQPKTEYQRSSVKKHSESSTTEGFGLVYYDTYDGNTDTIRLMIPNPKFVFKEQDAAVSKDNKPVESSDNKQFLNFTDGKDTVALSIDPATEQSKNFSHAHAATTPDPKPVHDSTIMRPSSSGQVLKPASCNAVASESDFLKVRKNMAAKYENEEMISEAKKYFKSKCFTTEQIRFLSTLFLSPEGKYRFFDAAYGHVADPDQFASLGAEIKDDYYLKRFKALTGE